MKSDKLTLRLRLITMISLLAITGCNASVKPSPAPLIGTTLSGTLTASPIHPTITPSPTITPLPTQTSTPIPSPTFTPTITPLPTLSSDQAQMLILDLLQTNRGCQLPCWWGFTPGQTDWQTAQRFLETFAYDMVDVKGKYFTVYFRVAQGNLDGFQQNYKVEDGIIQRITPQIVNSAYDLSTILAVYGLPAEIWMRTFADTPGGYLPFRVVLLYSAKGIMVQYEESAQIVNDKLRGCLQRASNRPQLWLWAPGNEMSFTEAVQNATGFGLDEEKYYRPLEEVTEMTVERFYQTFKNPANTTCLETPEELW